ncbi:acyl-CoA dehydrogenase family protein [Pseudonocardia ailaonensis]|uniref:Acyl-CoA dehydrogenase family protein n=1 Tax=Pseudonocardia ailaonensis TaxID=367279 RepID=A0ABN2MHY2_9PSEU
MTDPTAAEPDFAFDDEQLEFGRVVRQFLGRRSDQAEVRRLMATGTGHDPDVWKALALQLGVTGLAVPETFGGTGRGPLELVVVFEEFGRALACAPLLSTVGMAASLLTRLPADPAALRYLPGIVDGSVLGTVALGAGSEVDVPAAQAERSGSGWLLTGEATFVVDAHVADVVLLGAATAAGPTLFLAERGAAGLGATALDTLDPTRRLGRLRLRETPAAPVGEAGGARAHLAAVRDLAAVYLAAEQAGGAAFMLETVVEYAKHRVQFGRAIGSFQAVKHRCAEMLLLVESARSAAYHAGRAAADGSAELPALAALAKAYCSDAYVEVARASIQLLGGLGFTWEHPAHLHHRRALSSSALLGDPNQHRERLVRLLDGSHTEER